MKKRTLFILLALAINAIHSYAQTVVWQMYPVAYDQLKQIGENIFKIVDNGKIGLIASDGTIIQQPVCDEMGLYYEGISILTQKDTHGERVVGCLTDKGIYHSINGKYYTLNGQKFFSDGVISVRDTNGSLGYIDIDGNTIVGFDGKYDRIKPFVDGYAAVFKNRRYSLINKDGSAVKFRFENIAELKGGTNPYNGIVYIWDANGKFYTYNTKSDDVCKKVKSPSNIHELDYLYRFSCITKFTKDIPYKNISFKATHDIIPSIANCNGKYGYKIDNNIILPCQFTQAEPFVNGNAIVSLNDKKGILRYIDGENFGVVIPSVNYNFYSGNNVKCYFVIKIPDVWANKTISITLRDSNGMPVNTENKLYSYFFITHPSKSGIQNFTLEISAEDILLYKTILEYNFIRKERCHICGKDTDACQYKGKHPQPNKPQPNNKSEQKENLEKLKRMEKIKY